MATAKAHTKRQFPQDAECEVALSATPKRTCQADIGDDALTVTRQVDNDDPCTPGVSSVVADSGDDDDDDERCCDEMNTDRCWCILGDELPAQGTSTLYATYYKAIENLKAAYMDGNCRYSEAIDYLYCFVTVQLDEFHELCGLAQEVVFLAIEIESMIQTEEVDRTKKLLKKLEHEHNTNAGTKVE